MPNKLKTKKLKTKLVKKVGVYSVVLEANNQYYNASGDTLVETIRQIKPTFYKTKGILKVTKGDKQVTKLLYIPMMRKLFCGLNSFSANVALESTAKWIDMML